MPLDRTLQLHTAALVILGAVFVGQRQEAAVVPALAALAAVTAVAVTDVLGWLRLKRWMANSIAIIAVGWSLRDFFAIGSDEKLLAIANMLCYLQMVLLFQEKSLRVHWQLVVLSILQVVVAAALDLGPQFGLLLGCYALLALSTLFLLCVFREVRGNGRLPPAGSPQKGAAAHLLLRPPEVAATSLTETQVRRGLPAKILTRQVVLLAVVTLLFAVAFFYATPRWRDNSWFGGRSGGAGISGFRPEVRLEERGRIHLSSQVVMRVTFSRMSDRRPVLLVGEPYFLGEVLTEYKHDERGGRWLPRRPLVGSGAGTGGRRGIWQSPAQTTTNMVRQDIVLEATASNRIFQVVPAQALADHSFSAYSPPRRTDGEGYAAPRHKRYAAATPAIFNGRQLHAIPNPNRVSTIAERMAYYEEEEQTTAVDSDRFPRLTQIAADVLAQQQLHNARPLDKALALERHFVVPGRYQYSLNLNFTRDPSLDPVEDFVANHRTGHCEYFASALVLMLRSQGIPARMVVGYKGGSFNSVGQYYVVQQRHAHSWVEALLPTDGVPKGEIAGPPSDGGAWYRLDPTPGRELFVAMDEQSVGSRAAQAFDYFELLWRDYVLSLNDNRQEEIVYKPLQAQAGLLPSWVESRSMRNFLRRMSINLGFDSPRGQQPGGRRAFEASLAILVIGGLLGLAGIVQSLRFAGHIVGRWLRAAKKRAHSRSPAFYRRLERLLARLPAIRRTGQTPRELANLAREQLAQHAAEPDVARSPVEIVAAYYRVRFGGDRLDKNEMDGIEQSLNKLARAVSKRNGNCSE